MDSKRILVVEDEAVSAMELKATLRELGYEVLGIVKNGEEAVRRAGELLPDLILMDISLDGAMTGIQAAVEITKAHPIPIIYLTAHADREILGLAKITEPFGYLVKPCSKNTLAATIAVALYKSEADTVRRHAEDELKRNELRLKRLVDILQHPSDTIQEFLDYALHQAIQLTASKIGYIYHYHEERKEFVLNTWSKDVMAECAIPKPPTCYELDKTGIWGEAVRQRRSFIVNDFQAGNPLKKGYPEGHVQLCKFMTVPIFKGESIVGVVGLANKETDYDEIDILQVSLLMEAVWTVTERKVAELAMLESEGNYRRLFETMAQGVVYQAANGEIISANPAAERILGLDHRQMLGKTSLYHGWKSIREDGSELAGPEHPAMVALRTGKPVERFIMGVINPQDNAHTWISVTAIPLFELGATTPFQVHSIFDDISAQRRAELEYRILFREMMDGLALHEILCDQEGNPYDYRFLAVNPAFERITGLKMEDLLGRTVLEVLPDTERHWIETYGRVALTGELASFENYSAELKRHFEVTAFRPAPKQFACIIRDITERKQAAEKIQRLTNLYAALSECGQAMVRCGSEEELFAKICHDIVKFGGMRMVWIGFVEPETKLIQVVASAGLGIDYLQGIEISVDADSPYGIGPSGSAIREKRPFWCQDFQNDSTTAPWHERSKGYGWMASASLPLYRNGEAVGALTLYADEIHAFDEAAQKLLVDMSMNISYALDKFASEAKRKQEEEARATLQDQLNQAQKMESIGILAGGIAHDFNNILGVILGYTELALEDAPLDSKFAKDLDRVLSSTHRAKDLVKQILAFSRQSTVDRIPIKIQPLVKETLKMLRASLPSTITIHDDIHPQCGVVLADPTQVYQIVMNLCINAFHAMEKSGGLLSVTLKSVVIDSAAPGAGQELSPGEYVGLTVSDTGTGIGPDIIGKIFDPYFTTKEIGKGTGMGLAITHGLINSYGGTITVESILGQGTTFHVYFPVIQGEAMGAAEAIEAPRGLGRILFVDDEVLLAEMGKDMLERLGYSVTIYHRSIEALADFMDNPAQFDLVITDQTMPAMTGIELAKRLLEIRHDIPIILCTGFSQIIDEDTAKAIGIKEFALKPLTKSSIGNLVQKHLAIMQRADI